MNVEKYIAILFITVLTLSMTGMASEDIEKTNITITSRNIEIDKNSNQEIVLIHIDTNKIGYLNYIERYYSKNDTGVLNLDSIVMYYNDTLPNNTLMLRIKRPLDKYGNSYRTIKAIIYIDNNKELDTWFIFNDEEKESPGFAVVISIVSVTWAVHILKKRKTKI